MTLAPRKLLPVMVSRVLGDRTAGEMEVMAGLPVLASKVYAAVASAVTRGPDPGRPEDQQIWFNVDGPRSRGYDQEVAQGME